MAPLHNGRHERFAQELAKGKSADEAYVEAGYSGSSKSMQEAASRLSRNVKVQARVAEIQQRGA
ncbi:terminase small subunit [Xanthobacter oligotrophicus]|uniref:terminase small subunit n=1 Tax=Xanthobacter oligotrophicus TaxID=2607286 RepID=UPI00165D42B6|nr:terminase small subunit [Xanthobacter oligotrophicus]